MDGIGSVNTPVTQASQAVQAGQAHTVAGTNQTQSATSGLPPVNLAMAASINTINAELVSSQWGIDPAAAGGVFGGAAASGLFAGGNLLPVLTTITHANAEQALSLIGIRTPTPGGEAGASAAATGNAAAPSSSQQSTPAQAGSGSSAPLVVDPLWGRSA